MNRKKAQLQAGKTYAVKNGSSTYTIIVGDLSESTGSSSSSSDSSGLHVGVGSPSLNLGKSGSIYLDSLNKRVYVKDTAGWDSGFDMGGSGSGTNGTNGTNGRTTLEGGGPPSNSAVYAAALADAGVTAPDIQNGDLYLDTLNHVFYKRMSGAWVSRSSHKGQRGRTIFEGSGDPDDPNSELPSDISDAAEGDLYHDVVNFKWHRRNSSGIPGSRWDARSAYLGAIGPIGPNGLAGLDGLNGKDGKTTLEGNGPPSDSVVYAAALADAGIEASDVKNGDLYLDALNHVFYKRASDAWSSRTSHVGRNGKTIFDGSGDPDDPSSELPSDIADAAAGDLYHDVTNFKWYKRNSSGIPGERWDPRNSYKPGELKNISLATSFNLATAASSEWLTNSALAAVRENDTVLDPNNKRMYKRTSTGWEDQGSIAGGKGDKGDDGDNGQNGRDGVSAQLTNDSDVISADSDGSGYDFTDTGGEFEIRTGGAKVSSGVTYYAGASETSTTSTVNGLTLTINSSGAYSLSGAGWTQNFARFTMRAIYDGVTYTKVYKLTKARAGLIGPNGLPGSNGKDGADGAPGSAGSDGTGIYSTALIAESGTPSANTAYGTTRADDLLIDSTNHKIYKRSASGATFTWALQGTQFRGAAGATGPAAITGYLSNESHTVTANPDGTGYSTTGAGGTFYVNSGSSTVVAQNYYVGADGTSTSATQSKLTLSINSSGVYTLSGGSWESNSESFTLRAISGSTTVTKTYNIVKNKSSKNLSLVAKALTFSKNGAGSFYPSGQSITLTPQMQNLSSTTIAWTLRKIISGVSTSVSNAGGTNISITTGASPYATITSAQFNAATGGVIGAQLQITAAHDDGVEDTVTIGVVSDGSETDIYCAALGTAGSATDQRVPYDTAVGGGTGLRLSDLKADVGGIITAAEGSLVNYVSDFQSNADILRPSASYTFSFRTANLSGALTTYTTTINHRADGEDVDYTPTIFTVAVAGQYRITWQGSFKLRNYDPDSSLDVACYMSMLKAPAGSSSYSVIDEISANLSCLAAGNNKTAKKFTAGGASSTITLLDASAQASTPSDRWNSKSFIGRYYPDYEYVNKVTTLNLSVGDKIVFKARKGSYSILSYDPDTLDTINVSAAKYRDATEAWINANSASDDETDKDIDTIVMFQRVAD
jgi:hypothetical protein